MILLFFYVHAYSQDTSAEKILRNVTVYSQTRTASTEMSVNKIDINVAKKIPTIFGEQDILKTIQLLPGVTNTGDGSVSFNVRGGGADQNLIILDNAPIYSSAHALGVFSVFNSYALKDFKLYKGGIPVEFGDRLSSVLDIRQLTGSRTGWSGIANIGIISSNMMVQGPIYKRKDSMQANNSFFIAGRRTYADLFLPLVCDPNIRKSKLYFYDLNGKISWNITPKDDLSLSWYYGKDYVSLANIASAEWGNALGSINWNHTYNKKLSSNINTAYTQYTYGFNSQFTANNNITWTTSIKHYLASSKWIYLIHPKIKLKLGYQLNYYYVQPGLVTITDTTRTEHVALQNKQALENTLFIGVTHTIIPKLTLEYGIRYINFLRLGHDTLWQYQNQQLMIYEPSTKIYIPQLPYSYKAYKAGQVEYAKNLFEPRINVVYDVDRTQAIKLGYNRIYQPIQLVANTSAVLPMNYYMMSNQYVPIEYADQIALGYFKTLGRQAQYEVSAEIYYKSMGNLVDYIDGAEIILNNYIENSLLATKGYSYGIELMVSKNIGKWTGWVSYTYSRSLRKTENSVIGSGINNKKYYPAPYDIPHVLNVVLMYDITPRISVSGLFTFRSGLPTTYPVGQYYVFDRLITQYSDRNGNRLKPYNRLDLSVIFKSKPRKHWEGKLIASIYNVYNRLNPVSMYYNNKKIYEVGYYRIIPSISYEIQIK